MKRISILTAILFLAGCAGSSIKGTYYAEDKSIDQELKISGKSKVIVVREDAILQSLASLNILIDGQQKASIGNGSEIAILVEPGKHFIESRLAGLDAKSGCGFEFELVEGETIKVSAVPSKAGVGLPIVSILTNPVTCKFLLEPIAI